MVIALQREINGALPGGRGRVVIDLGAVSGVGAQTLSLFCSALRRENRGAALAIVARIPACGACSSGARSMASRCIGPSTRRWPPEMIERGRPGGQPVEALTQADPDKPIAGPAGGLARPRGRPAAGADRELFLITTHTPFSGEQHAMSSRTTARSVRQTVCLPALLAAAVLSPGRPAALLSSSAAGHPPPRREPSPINLQGVIRYVHPGRRDRTANES